MKLSLSSDQIRSLLDIDPLELPKYVSPLINLANTFAQGTRPSVVGKMTELIQEMGDGDILTWEKWYLERHKDKLIDAKIRIISKIEEFKKVIASITEEQVETWVRDLVLVKTYIGLKAQDAILRRVSSELSLSFREATTEEESKNIDGWIGSTPVSVKPLSYRQKPELMENLPSAIIFYSKDQNGKIQIEFDESKIR